MGFLVIPVVREGRRNVGLIIESAPWIPRETVSEARERAQAETLRFGRFKELSGG